MMEPVHLDRLGLGFHWRRTDGARHGGTVQLANFPRGIFILPARMPRPLFLLLDTTNHQDVT